MRGGRRLPRAKKVKLMAEACSFVNLKFEELTNKYPFELSGGQMQRLMIARIFLLKPKILLADEPTSMIDACSRATILDMLMQLRDEIGMTLIFITHDIGLAYYVSDSVYIMEHGKFVESGSADEVILHPKEAYTQRLINDVPKIYEEWDLSTVYKAARYPELLRELPVGLSEWAVHLGLDSPELLTIEPDGKHIRQMDFDFLTSQQAKDIVKEEGIILLDYRALQDVWKET
jgi:ABC-type dipeptide/oligopeptide/nickel transport system ATPase component